MGEKPVRIAPLGESDRLSLTIGDMAPDFTLPSHNEGELNLAWYRGRKNVVLAFYPADWTPVCATQIPEYQKVLSRFEQSETQLLGISTDSVPCHLAWARSLGGIEYPLMSDYYPHGEVASRYGVLNKRGYAERAVFLIDICGVIRFIDRVEITRLPDNDKLFDQIAKLGDEQETRQQ
ncbi:MAG: redoxin domain-containing protein [Candidatus Zixiibacteriota bacterium]